MERKKKSELEILHSVRTGQDLVTTHGGVLSRLARYSDTIEYEEALESDKDDLTDMRRSVREILVVWF